MENSEEIKPFSQAYVLRVTAKHMRKSVDISIRKTYERVKDFKEDTAEAREIFTTLGMLHKMRKVLDDFQKENQDNFKVKDNRVEINVQ